jgi:hypothetical protein
MGRIQEQDQDRPSAGDDVPGDEGHGFAETLPADGAGWDDALDPTEPPSEGADEPRRGRATG